MENKKDSQTVELKFSKQKLLASEMFSIRKDVLGVVMSDNEQLTVQEVRQRIENFMKGKVN